MSILKFEREKLGKDLKEISEATRIRYTYLRAIEELDFKRLPVEVYSRSYIKDYARHLGVNPDDVLAAYDRFLIEHKRANEAKSIIDNNEIPKEESINKDNKYPKGQSSEGRLFNVSRSFFKIAAVFSVMAIVGILFYGLQSGRFEIAEKAEYRPPLPQQPVAVIADQQLPREEITSNSNDNRATSERPKVSKHNLDITATERVWIQVVIDGKEKKELTLKPGENLRYGAEDSFNLIIGNAGGIKLIFDDRPIDNLGTSGTVVKIRLPQPSLNAT